MSRHTRAATELLFAHTTEERPARPLVRATPRQLSAAQELYLSVMRRRVRKQRRDQTANPKPSRYRRVSLLRKNARRKPPETSSVRWRNGIGNTRTSLAS